MTYKLGFSAVAWDDYLHWQQTDKAVLRRLNVLLRELQRTPFAGIGKPELLRHARAGTWSRRLTEEHRLVYMVDNDFVVVLQARFHYSEK